MHFSIFVALIGLVGAAVAAPQPEAEPGMSREDQNYSYARTVPHLLNTLYYYRDDATKRRGSG
jgi:hypothetical protein